jgi:hypothetical protein
MFFNFIAGVFDIFAKAMGGVAATEVDHGQEADGDHEGHETD